MIINEEQLSSICGILANFNTHKEIDKYLESSGISNLGTPTKITNLGYITGSNKKDKLLLSFKEEYKKNGASKILIYIEKVVNPIQYTLDDQRHKYSELVESLNKVLLFLGCQINESGKLTQQERAKSLSEVDERVNHLKKELLNRNIHSEVYKYCVSDYLQKDYFDAINEAVKGCFDRVRKITGLTTDGCDLLNTAFSKNNPYIYFNKQQTESEWNEHNGLKELMFSLYHIVRNPLSHTPKIQWNILEERALDILGIVSFVHKYLDICYKHPSAP